MGAVLYVERDGFVRETVDEVVLPIPLQSRVYSPSNRLCNAGNGTGPTPSSSGVLSGQLAFRGDSSVELMHAILKEEPPALPASVPPPLDRVVRRCLEKNPARRFQSRNGLQRRFLGSHFDERVGDCFPRERPLARKHLVEDHAESPDIRAVVHQLAARLFGRHVGCCPDDRAYIGTAAQFTVVPLDQVAPLAENVSMDQGACLGIPGITAHRAVHVAGGVSGHTVLVQGAAGAVGLCAVQLARQAGAQVIGTVRSLSDEATAKEAGAHEVVLSDQEFVARVQRLAPEGIDHIVEVAFGANIENDVELLKAGGSITAYATDSATPKLPFWPMVFKNVRIFFLGSDDFPKEAKMSAAQDLNRALEAGWSGFKIGERVPLSEIVRAHELAEHPVRPGRVVVTL